MNSSAMSSLITTKLREDALELRRLSSKSADARSTIGGVKDKMMREIHLILTLMLGPPPNPNKELTWEYYDKDDKFGRVKTTPLKFAAELSSKASVRTNAGSDVHELFSLVNDPRNSYGELLSVSRLGNVVGMRGIRYVNVDMSTMKKACTGMLLSDLPIFFGSDVGKFLQSSAGIMDNDAIDYELGFNIRLGLSKAQRVMTGESAMTHAMVLTGVHVVDGKPVRWRVQNSWGEAAGTKGWFVMSDSWMDEFVYQAVVDPRYVLRESALDSSGTDHLLGSCPRMSGMSSIRSQRCAYLLRSDVQDVQADIVLQARSMGPYGCFGLECAWCLDGFLTVFLRTLRVSLAVFSSRESALAWFEDSNSIVNLFRHR